MPDHASILSPVTAASPAAEKDIQPLQEQLHSDQDKELLQPLLIQCKLAIGAPDDPLEDEADTMADTIMRMPEQSYIQRKCSHCEEEEKLQRKPLVSFIQRKESSAGAVASDAITNQIHSSKGSGSSMDSHTQSFMQSRFGTDFSHVKIHTGANAAQLNRELSAKAFTVGSDIYFNDGQYNPNSNEGKHLLAHELTHTVQQGGMVERKVQRQWDAIGTTDCSAVPSGAWLQSVLVNQEIPQSVTLNWSNGTSESAICSTGKGHCCADASSDTACDAATSNVTDTNCTPITSGAAPVISERKLSHNGWLFWNTFVPHRGIALHQHDKVTGEPLSHGCVRMEEATAKKIFCGARRNQTQVRVQGFARPYCASPNLQAEWLDDIGTAQTPTPGLAADVVAGIREVRKTLRSSFGVNDTALNPLIAGINPGNIASRIPRCSTTAAATAAPASSTTEEQQVFTQANNISHLMVVFAQQMIALEAALRSSASLIAAQTVVSNSGTNLWQAALSRAQHLPAVAGQMDDQPLYLARLRMIGMIRGFSASFAITTTDRQALVDSFEQSSRGINAVPFAGIAATQKKILISGFDPFTGDGNPSGAIVQALSGQSVTSGACSAMIHGAIFPVRYHDFDQGIVERYFSSFLSGANRADMIMTISLNPNISFTLGSGGSGSPAHGNLFFDHWAARQRGGGSDNNGLTSTDTALETNLSARYPGTTSRRDEFINSSLPFGNMMAAAVNHSFSGVNTTGAPVNNDVGNASGNPAGLNAVSGSGGNYLSNEIFYRVRLLQINQTPVSTIPMGHLHVPLTAVADYPALVARVRLLLTQSLTNLCATP
ncbi:MAG: DUF4157 domain-containing protein [Chitinophagaceae bacterium]|nr:DUF4157 domain-containing protein [Chitinophagaceae bacterium]